MQQQASEGEMDSREVRAMPAAQAGLSPTVEPLRVSPVPASIPIAMDDLTLEALRGSIAKWEAIVAGTGADRGWRNCPLCTAFLDESCRNCPVSVAVGNKFCDGTPYEKWATSEHVKDDADGGGFPINAEGRRLAQAELDFLRSLLPAQGGEARRAETGTGSVHEHPVGAADAPALLSLLHSINASADRGDIVFRDPGMKMKIEAAIARTGGK